MRSHFTLIALLVVAQHTAPEAATGPADRARSVIVYHEPGAFCGWPANEGAWIWGSEILVGFEVRPYRPNAKGHSAAEALGWTCSRFRQDRRKERPNCLTSRDAGVYCIRPIVHSNAFPRASTSAIHVRANRRCR